MRNRISAEYITKDHIIEVARTSEEDQDIKVALARHFLFLIPSGLRPVEVTLANKEIRSMISFVFSYFQHYFCE